MDKKLDKLENYLPDRFGTMGECGTSGQIGYINFGSSGNYSNSSSGNYSNGSSGNYSNGSSGDMILHEGYSVKAEIKKQNIIKRFFNYILSLFVNDKIIPMIEQSNSNNKDDYKKIYVEQSKNRIKELIILNEMINSPIVKDIISNLEILHDLILNNNIKIMYLEKFHMYYTDNFISYLKKVIENEMIEKDKKINRLKKELKDIEERLTPLDIEINSINNIKKDEARYTPYVINNILNNIDLSFVSKDITDASPVINNKKDVKNKIKKIDSKKNKYDSGTDSLSSEVYENIVSTGSTYSNKITRNTDDNVITYSEYLDNAKNIDNTIKYSEYIAEQLNKVIDYTEYISENFENKIDSEIDDLLDSLSKLNK